jgi:hypothetical protein
MFSLFFFSNLNPGNVHSIIVHEEGCMNKSGLVIPATKDIRQPYTSFLHQEYKAYQELYQSQPRLIKRFLDAQSRLLAEAVMLDLSQVQFLLPDRITVEGQELVVDFGQREQLAGGLRNRLGRFHLRDALNVRFLEMEQSGDEALAVCGQLMRYTTAVQMIYQMLPDGRRVNYIALAGEEIPTIPAKVMDENLPEALRDGNGKRKSLKSAMMAATDAIVEEGPVDPERGELQVPYSPAALLFFLPQWVAFDDQARLLVKSVNQAEAYQASMRNYMDILHAAVALAPYVVSDQTYQQKRFGMLGQMINQGRNLALYKTDQIIAEIKRRVAANDLNRGLGLSLPFFDDQDLKMRTLEISVIPFGRIMFASAMVVRGMQEESAKVAQDTRLNASTRRHLLIELHTIEHAFIQLEAQ